MKVLFEIVFILLKILAIVVPVLICVAYFTLAERKVMGSMQRRKGPNVVGFFGILQPLADALKLILKEPIMPSSASTLLYLISPGLCLVLSLLAWSVLPFGPGQVLVDLNIGLLYVFAISSLGVYGVIFAGYSSNSKYSFLSALRAAAQMVSYEVSLGLILISVLLCSNSLNLTQVVLAQKESIWYVVPFFPLCLIWWTSCFVETARAPFDMIESEAELISGIATEYSSLHFGLFFLSEYANMIFMSVLTVILFFGGWLPFLDLSSMLPILRPIMSLIPIGGSFWLALKTSLFLFSFIWIRAAYPRYRYDQVMHLGWKVFLPISLGAVILVAGVIVGFEA